jgi:hypothetical protein
VNETCLKSLYQRKWMQGLSVRCEDRQRDYLPECSVEVKASQLARRFVLCDVSMGNKYDRTFILPSKCTHCFFFFSMQKVGLESSSPWEGQRLRTWVKSKIGAVEASMDQSRLTMRQQRSQQDILRILTVDGEDSRARQ